MKYQNVDNPEEVLARYTEALEEGLELTQESRAEVASAVVARVLDETATTLLLYLADEYQRSDEWKNGCASAIAMLGVMRAAPEALDDQNKCEMEIDSVRETIIERTSQLGAIRDLKRQLDRVIKS